MTFQTEATFWSFHFNTATIYFESQFQGARSKVIIKEPPRKQSLSPQFTACAVFVMHKTTKEGSRERVN